MFASGAGATWRLLVPNLTRARVSSGTSDFRSRSTNYKKVPTPQHCRLCNIFWLTVFVSANALISDALFSVAFIAANALISNAFIAVNAYFLTDLLPPIHYFVMHLLLQSTIFLFCTIVAANQCCGAEPPFLKRLRLDILRKQFTIYNWAGATAGTCNCPCMPGADLTWLQLESAPGIRIFGASAAQKS